MKKATTDTMNLLKEEMQKAIASGQKGNIEAVKQVLDSVLAQDKQPSYKQTLKNRFKNTNPVFWISVAAIYFFSLWIAFLTGSALLFGQAVLFMAVIVFLGVYTAKEDDTHKQTKMANKADMSDRSRSKHTTDPEADIAPTGNVRQMINEVDPNQTFIAKRHLLKKGEFNALGREFAQPAQSAQTTPSVQLVQPVQSVQPSATTAESRPIKRRTIFLNNTQTKPLAASPAAEDKTSVA